MIGTAIIEVTYPNQQPYQRQHTWTSEGPLQAPTDLEEWKVKTEKEQGCTITIVEWKIDLNSV